MTNIWRRVHLFSSAVVVIGVGVIYGLHPTYVLPKIFDFILPQSIDLLNIFRAMMGLYIGFAIFWLVGVYNKSFWRSATISNIIFMGGLAIGRIISFILDGTSFNFLIGFVLEVLFCSWGIYNLRKEFSRRTTSTI